MVVRLEAVSFEAVDALASARFWAGLLERELRAEPGGALLPGDQTQLGLRFVASPSEPVGRPRLHLHLTSGSLDDQRRTVETALRLGGRHLDVGQGPEDQFVVLSDPGGGELCVIEPGNAFLAGTGRLGEVTCDGSRAAGLFWRDALDWPLVWDRDAQTAIQSPLGGTKISWDSWGGAPPADEASRRRQRFDLVTTDTAAETERLLALGALRLGEGLDGAGLADPDGNAFGLRETRPAPVPDT